ncbi:MAG: ABC transporter ATP-binding protein, partial [Salegentibacter sp.]
MKEEFIIEAKELTKMFGDFTAVDHISFHVEKGEIFGFLGANGAGKTTAMKMLIGISRPTAGEAKVAGFDVSTEAERIKENIGYMSQRFALYDDLTVKENIRFFGGIYGLSRKKIREKTAELIEELGLQKSAGELVGSLPLGWKQKIAFSVALLHDPKIIFLDEPTGGVDPVTRRQFWEMIYAAAARGTTIF